LSRRSRRYLRQSPDRDGRESTHIDTAFMGLTSWDGVTVDCKLPARRATGQPNYHVFAAVRHMITEF
jgi:hypothetical protein